MGRAVRPWLFDPGWLYVIAGLAMCSAITLIPAQRDLVEIEGLLERLEMREARLGDRLGAHARFLEALDRGDDDLVVRLAAAQLNMVRAGEHPMLRTSVESASVTDWIETSLPPLPPPPAPEPVSMLAQLVEGPARLWLLGASVMTIFIGLLIGPARSRHEAFGSLLAVPDDEGDGSDVDDAAARKLADTVLPAEASEPVAADDPEPPVVVVRARRVQRFEDEPSPLALTIGDRVTGAMSQPSSRSTRRAGDIVLRSEIHAPPVLITAPARVIRSALDREDEMHDEEIREMHDEMHDEETRTPRPAASVESKDAVAAEVDASDIGGEDPDHAEDEEYEYVDEDGEPVDEDDDEYEYEYVDEDGNPVDEDEDEEDDEESEPVDEEEEEYEYVDEDGNPVDEDEDEEDDEESEPVDEEEEEEEEYEYVDEDGNPVDEDEDEEDDEESEPVDEEEEEEEEEYEYVDEDGNPVDEDEDEEDDEESEPVDEEEEEEEEEYEYVDEDGNPVDEDDDEYEYVDEDGNPVDEDDEEYEYELVSEDGEPVDDDDPAEKSD